MNEILIIGAIVILLCIVSSKLLYRLGVPTLLIFILLGMIFGRNGIVGIEFSDYEYTKQICTFGLIFIMFYGGFCTNWKVAKPVAIPAALLSTFGVAFTALITGVFCKFGLRMTWLEGLLIGSIVSSTDAASVFAILRSRRLNLKEGIAPLLELESGSNDPAAYMMTVIMLTFMSNSSVVSFSFVFKLILMQITMGIVVGYVLIKLSTVVLRKVRLEINGLYPIFVCAIAILSYSLSELVGGNGYLSVYLVGIGLGNSKILHKKSLVHFFDGISWLMQILLFFMLGLLAYPSKLPTISLNGFLLSLFMIFIARPVVVFIIMHWFRFTIKEIAFISFVGLRGAASIVFAVFALTGNVFIKNDIYHLIFFVALFSVFFQGTLLPLLAKRLKLVDNDNPHVLKSFTDYEEENATELIELEIDDENLWSGLSIMDADIPEEILVVMIKRGNNIIIPKGSTIMRAGDKVVLSGVNLHSLLK